MLGMELRREAATVEVVAEPLRLVPDERFKRGDVADARRPLLPLPLPRGPAENKGSIA